MDDDRASVIRVYSEAVRIGELHRTIRAAVISVSSVIGAAMVSVAMIRLQTPSKIDIYGLIVAVLASPSILLVITIKTYISYIDKEHRRTQELERRIDPNRSSSLLENNPDLI